MRSTSAPSTTAHRSSARARACATASALGGIGSRARGRAAPAGRVGAGLAHPPRAALTTSLASACTRARWSGALEGLGIDLVDVLGAGGAGGEPRALGRHLEAADRGAVARGRGQLARDRLPGKGRRRRRRRGRGRRAWPSPRATPRRRCGRMPGRRAGRSARRSAGWGSCRWPRGSRRRAGRAGCRPCRSTRPCRRSAGSSRPRTPRRRSPREPSSSPGTNHLKPTGTSSSVRPRSAATRSIIDDETRVLPMAVLAGQPGRAPP